MTDALVKIDAAKQALTEAKSLQEILEIRDRATAMHAYAVAKGAGEAANQAKEIELRARRRAGEFLEGMDKNPGGRPLKTPDTMSGVSAPTLADLGISEKQSSRWQTEANLPEDEFEQYIAETKAGGAELTSGAVYKLARKYYREQEREPLPIPSSPVSKSPRLIVGRAENMIMIEGDSVDLIITSPPYNMGQEQWPMGGDGRIPREGGIGYSDSLPEDEYQAWQIQCLVEMYRVAKPGASLFYNHKIRSRDGGMIHPLDWLRDGRNPWILRQEIVWDRGSTHNHSPTLFWPEDERIYWMTKGKPMLPNRPIGKSTVWRFHGPVADTLHPAPFDEELPRRCIEAVGRDGIVVLDPFAGSCTTLKVALNFGYEAIGVDICAKYLENAKKVHGWEKANET